MTSTNEEVTQEEIQDWVQQTLKRRRWEDCSVKILGSSEKGDGYLGNITFVEVGDTTTSPDEKQYLVVKSGKKSTQLRSVMPIKEAFKNEIYFYSEILPTFTNFQKKKGIQKPFHNAASLHGTLILEDMEVLILENLKMAGFVLHDRTMPMNRKHVESVLTTYGKLHAISFALRDQEPEIYERFDSNMIDIMKVMMKTYKDDKEVNNFNDIIEIAKRRKEFLIVKKVSEFQRNMKEIFTKILDSSNEYNVIVHGDCWNNNFMFKYNDKFNSELKEVRLLDFQLSKMASPVIDLSYFLFTCLCEEDLNNFDELNNIYYDSFSSFLRQLGSDPQKLFPYEEFMNQWKKYAGFGLTMMPGIMKVCLSEKDEVVDLTETSEAGGDLRDAFSYTVKNIVEYEKRTLPVMKLAVKKGFI